MIEDILKVFRTGNLVILQSSIPLPEGKVFSFLKVIKKNMGLRGKWEGILSSEDGRNFILYDEKDEPDLVKGVILKAIADVIDAKVSLKRYLRKYFPKNRENLSFERIIYFIFKAYSHIEPELIKGYKEKYLPFKNALVKEGLITEDFKPLAQASAIENFINRFAGMEEKRVRVCPVCLEEVLLSGRASGRKKYHKKCKSLASTLEKRKQRGKTKRVEDFVKEIIGGGRKTSGKNQNRKRKQNSIVDIIRNAKTKEEEREIKKLPPIDEAIKKLTERFRNNKREMSIASYCLLLEYTNKFLTEDELRELKNGLAKLHSLALPLLLKRKKGRKPHP